MEGFVTDYISMFAAELGKPSIYEEYAQFMTGYPPGQMPVLSAIARGFATFDHWFCDVPSCTFPNRSFFHAATQRLRGEHDTAGIVHRAQHRRDRVTAPPGAMRSHGSWRWCGRGAGTTAGRTASPVRVTMSGAPGLLIQLTARR
ncbi:MAG TPA: alkaline phosphatase family protein [Streptosporangiaceae bacterium]|nr:alkaline phosphatase family protein [Streptosporangiaceae bacterium]